MEERSGLRHFKRAEILKTGMVTALTAQLLLGSVACGTTEHYTAGPRVIPVYPNSEEYNEVCDDILPQTLSDAKALFESSEKSGDLNIDAADVRRQTAESLGLTIYDYRTEFRDLINNAHGPFPEDISVVEYVSRVTEFLNRYSVELVVSSTDNEGGVLYRDSQPFTMKEITDEDSRNIKQQLIGFIESIGEMPVELVHFANLKKIILVHGPFANGRSSAGYVNPNLAEIGTIYVDPSRPTASLLEHEIFHLMDMRECGLEGMYQDTQYAALNPISTLYEGHTKYVSEESAFEGASGPDVVVRSDYGFTNIVEDKATLGEAILDPAQVRTVVEAAESPVLQSKSLLLLARLYQDRPDILQYLAAVSHAELNR
ncbi:MAG TPA: hypothetical protein VFS65_01480 [Candidatus Saccharimonadales bacterium]|nr:hypothetical protein [Candidatus Saccharimonadales bacterium]